MRFIAPKITILRRGSAASHPSRPSFPAFPGKLTEESETFVREDTPRHLHGAPEGVVRNDVDSRAAGLETRIRGAVDNAGDSAVEDCARYHGQGSSVTYKVQPSRRQFSNRVAAAPIARISAWAVASRRVST